MLYGSSLAAGLVFEMWNIVWIQLTFWMTLAALLFDHVGRGERWLACFVAAVLVGSAATFLWFGDGMVRAWDDTEVRELIIPFGLTLAAMQAGFGVGRVRDPGLSRGDEYGE